MLHESRRFSKRALPNPAQSFGGGLTLSAVALVIMNSACPRPQRPAVQMARTTAAARHGMIAPPDHFDLVVGGASLTRGPLKLDIGGASSASTGRPLKRFAFVGGVVNTGFTGHPRGRGRLGKDHSAEATSVPPRRLGAETTATRVALDTRGTAALTSGSTAATTHGAANCHTWFRACTLEQAGHSTERTHGAHGSSP